VRVCACSCPACLRVLPLCQANLTVAVTKLRGDGGDHRMPDAEYDQAVELVGATMDTLAPLFDQLPLPGTYNYCPDCPDCQRRVV